MNTLYKSSLFISLLAIFAACSSNNTAKIEAVSTLDTAFLSNKEFALAYQDGQKIVATSIDTMKQISFGGATDPAISPDGTKLAYTVSNSEGHRSIWIADMSNKTQAQLPVDHKNYYQAMWSPDGNSIAFSILNGANLWKVGIVKTNDAGYQVLDSTSNLNVYSPTWKNANEITGHDLKNLYTFDLSGKLINTLALESLIGKALSVSSSNRFFYSKDGKKLIFNAGNTDVVEHSVGPNEAVYVLDVASKKTSRISPEGLNAPYVFVTADDRIFFSASKTTDTNFQIYAADLNGNIKKLVEKGMHPTGALK